MYAQHAVQRKPRYLLDKQEYEHYADQAKKEAYYDIPYYDHVLWSKERKLKVPSLQEVQLSLPIYSPNNTCRIQ